MSIVCFQSWRARVSGYEGAIQLFRQLDKGDPEWNKFTSIVKKFVVDNNAVAQEKGLEATLIFVENSVTAERFAGYNFSFKFHSNLYNYIIM